MPIRTGDRVISLRMARACLPTGHATRWARIAGRTENDRTVLDLDCYKVAVNEAKRLTDVGRYHDATESIQPPPCA